jgi:hypothetical protein
MPTTELQQDLFGGDPQPPQGDPYEVVECVGGCGRMQTRSQLIYVEDRGYICARCFDDHYVICPDCSVVVRLNRHRESGAIVNGPDDRARCRECHEAVYRTCVSCGSMHHCTDDNNHTHPTEGGHLCNQCWNDYWFTCVVCEEVHDRRDALTSSDNESMCRECFATAYVACGQCGRAILLGDHLGWAGDPFCADCYGRAETWKIQPWSGEPGSFDKIGSKRRFGVELETYRCPGYERLHGETEWGCVYECSTPGKEFVSPILQGDLGFHDVRDFCGVAESKD